MMGHKGLKISIVDRMPPPSDLGTSDRRRSDYADGDSEDAMDSDDGGEGGDRDAKLSAVSDFFTLGKKGDYEGALEAYEQLMEMCARG